jgi:hypothetical protein
MAPPFTDEKTDRGEPHIGKKVEKPVLEATP